MRNIKTLLLFCLVLSFSGCGRNDKKAKGDWCAEHNLPESQCAICNPSLKKELKQGAHPEEHKEEQTVKITEESKKIMGLEIVKADYRTIEEVLIVTGKITQDTEKIHHISPKISGEVIEVKVRLGDIIKEGQVLALIRSLKTGNTEEIISANTGMIIGENISEGIQVDETLSIFTVGDLNTISANFDIYEKDIGKVKIGQKIKIESISYPNKVFAGSITFISLSIDEKTRTVKVRAEIENKEYFLKFNMFVTGNIIIQEKQVLVIPSQSIQEFEEGKGVFVQTGENEFAMKKVKIGIQSGKLSEVAEGLNRGEKVVTDGNFLLKSELLKSKMGAGCAD